MTEKYGVVTDVPKTAEVATGTSPKPTSTHVIACPICGHRIDLTSQQGPVIKCPTCGTAPFER